MAQTRTRVVRTARGDWRWWLWGDAYDDTRDGYETEVKARLALAQALGEHEDVAEREHTEREFWKVAF